MILHTEVNGSGEALVFLHTGLQTGKTELDLQNEYFKQNYKVVLPDLRGHGKSPSDDFSNYLKKTAEDLAETLEDLSIESAHIAGCSIGGLVALVFAKSYPGRVKSLILSGIIPERPENWETLDKEESKNIAKIMENQEAVSYFNHLHEGDWKKLLNSMIKVDWYPFEETADVAALSMPVLFIVGEMNDHETIGAINYPKMNDNIHTSIIPFAGHTPHLDQPEIYNIIVEKFLTLNGQGEKIEI